MDCQKIALEETNKFSAFFLDYLSQKEELKPFYGNFPSLTHFKDQVEKKAGFPQETRQILADVVQQQYNEIDISAEVENNIDLLKNQATFTITTGHQLNIVTGPLYFIYKIITVINCCKQLEDKYPQYNFVPVFWMASEDHDFEEINNFRFNGKEYVWNTDQQGATGRFDPSLLLALIKDISGIPSFFSEAYKAPTLADAVRHYVNHLFGDQGLVIVDADNAALKKLFTEVMADDLFNNSAKKLVENTSDQLEQLSYKPQVYPREINFFYLKENARERIVKENDSFKVLNTELLFSREEIKEEIDKHPERFSPNVVLRPLYQEVILPNLAYVGGPAEVVYWLQLKSTFDHYKVPFPIVMPRNFGMIIPENIHKKIAKTGIELRDFFQSREELTKAAVANHASHNIYLNGQMEKMNELFEMIRQQAEELDPTLGPHVESQKSKTRKRLEIIEKKFMRAEKRKQADRLQQIESILDYLFPGNALQERTDNFLNFYLEEPSFIEDLIACFDPFDYCLHVLNYGK
jgi:bacillithiol biosynthesis cysteine-adding enzyme BshC